MNMLEQTSTDRQNPQTIINNYSMMAMFASVFPYPFIGGIAVKVLQLKMIYELTRVYQVVFSENLVKSILLIIASGIAASGFVGIFSMLVSRTTPRGLFLNVSALAVGAGAETYAVGYIMQKHFASGGTLNDFNLERSRQHLADLYEEGKSNTKKMFNKKAKRYGKEDDTPGKEPGE